MYKQDIIETYRKWWVGKKCCPIGHLCQFKLVKDVNFYGPPSGIYGTAELVFEDGSMIVVSGGVNSFRARKKDVEVENNG